MKIDTSQPLWEDWARGLETEMSYYGARAAVGDFGSFGVLIMVWCALSLLFTLALALAAVFAVGWVIWKIVQGFVDLWRSHAAS